MQGEKRADYGERLVECVGSIRLGLTKRFSQHRCENRKPPLLSARLTPLLVNVPTLSAMFTLPWSAYLRLLAVKSPEARKFYEAEAIRTGWSVRQLDRQIGSQFYERIALSRNKAAMLEKAETPEPSDAITPEEAIKDPFVLEFLNLKDEYSESELEEALIQHLADFLLELGDDFAFLGRQRRLHRLESRQVRLR
jgi:predicted nuclease of restriction endonuclease-like (RecB) superfamily